MQARYGALDMAGNVWEWVRIRYDGDLLCLVATREPDRGRWTGSTNRVLRGGSWTIPGGNVRSANRDGNTPDIRYVNYRLPLRPLAVILEYWILGFLLRSAGNRGRSAERQKLGRAALKSGRVVGKNRGFPG